MYMNRLLFDVHFTSEHQRRGLRVLCDRSYCSDVYPAVFNALYQCQTTQLKSIGSVIISILVATLSLFTSGWGIVMLAAAFLEKRNRKARRAGG